MSCKGQQSQGRRELGVDGWFNRVDFFFLLKVETDNYSLQTRVPKAFCLDKTVSALTLKNGCIYLAVATG